MKLAILFAILLQISCVILLSEAGSRGKRHYVPSEEDDTTTNDDDENNDDKSENDGNSENSENESDDDTPANPEDVFSKILNTAQNHGIAIIEGDGGIPFKFNDTCSLETFMNVARPHLKVDTLDRYTQYMIREKNYFMDSRTNISVSTVDEKINGLIIYPITYRQKSGNKPAFKALNTTFGRFEMQLKLANDVFSVVIKNFTSEARMGNVFVTLECNQDMKFSPNSTQKEVEYTLESATDTNVERLTFAFKGEQEQDTRCLDPRFNDTVELAANKKFTLKVYPIGGMFEVSICGKALTKESREELAKRFRWVENTLHFSMSKSFSVKRELSCAIAGRIADLDKPLFNVEEGQFNLSLKCLPYTGNVSTYLFTKMSLNNFKKHPLVEAMKVSKNIQFQSSTGPIISSFNTAQCCPSSNKTKRSKDSEENQGSAFALKGNVIRYTIEEHMFEALGIGGVDNKFLYVDCMFDLTEISIQLTPQIENKGSLLSMLFKDFPNSKDNFLEKQFRKFAEVLKIKQITFKRADVTSTKVCAEMKFKDGYSLISGQLKVNYTAIPVCYDTNTKKISFDTVSDELFFNEMAKITIGTEEGGKFSANVSLPLTKMEDVSKKLALNFMPPTTTVTMNNTSEEESGLDEEEVEEKKGKSRNRRAAAHKYSKKANKNNTKGSKNSTKSDTSSKTNATEGAEATAEKINEILKSRWPKGEVKCNYSDAFPNLKRIFIKNATVNGMYNCTNSFIKGEVKLNEQNATMELVYKSIDDSGIVSHAALCLVQKMKVKDPCDQTTEEKVDEQDEQGFGDTSTGSMMDILKKKEMGGSLPWLQNYMYAKFPAKKRFYGFLNQFRQIVTSVQSTETFFQDYQDNNDVVPMCKYVEDNVRKLNPKCLGGIMIHMADLKATCHYSKDKGKMESCMLFRKIFDLEKRNENFFDSDYWGCMKPNEFNVFSKFERNLVLAEGIRILDSKHQLSELINPETGESLQTTNEIKGNLDIDNLPKSCFIRVRIDFMGMKPVFTIDSINNVQGTTLLGIPFVDEIVFRSSQSAIKVGDTCFEADSTLKIGRIVDCQGENTDNRITFNPKKGAKTKQWICSNPKNNKFYAKMEMNTKVSIWKVMESFLGREKRPKKFFKDKYVYGLSATYHNNEKPVDFGENLVSENGLWYHGFWNPPKLEFNGAELCKANKTQNETESAESTTSTTPLKKKKKKSKQNKKKGKSDSRSKRQAEEETTVKDDDIPKDLKKINFYSSTDTLTVVAELGKIKFSIAKDKNCTRLDILTASKNENDTLDGIVLVLKYYYYSGFYYGYIRGYFQTPMFSTYGKMMIKDLMPESCGIKDDDDPNSFEFRPTRPPKDPNKLIPDGEDDDVKETDVKVNRFCRVAMRGVLAPTSVKESKFEYKMLIDKDEGMDAFNVELNKIFVDTNEYLKSMEYKVRAMYAKFESMFEKDFHFLYNNKTELQEEMNNKRNEIRSLNEVTNSVCGDDCEAVTLPGFVWKKKDCRYSKDLTDMPCLHYSKNAYVASDVDCLLKCETKRKLSGDQASSKRSDTRDQYMELKKATGKDRLMAIALSLLKPAYPEQLNALVKEISEVKLEEIKLQNNDTVFVCETDWERLIYMRSSGCGLFKLKVYDMVLEETFCPSEQTIASQIAKAVFNRVNRGNVERMNELWGFFNSLMDECNFTIARFKQDNKKELRQANESDSAPLRKSEIPVLSDYIGRETGFNEDPYETNFLMNNYAPWEVLKKNDPLTHLPQITVRGSLEKKSDDACTETRHKVVNFRNILKYMKSWTSSFKLGYADLNRVENNIHRGLINIDKDIVKRGVLGSTTGHSPMNRWINQTKSGFTNYITEAKKQIQQVNMYGPYYMKNILSNVYTPQKGETFEALLYRSSQEADATFKKTVKAQDKPFENLAMTMINFWRQNNTLLQMAPALDRASAQLKELDKRTIACKH